MVQIRGGFDTSTVYPKQQKQPRKLRKTEDTTISPIILNPPLKSSTATIANEVAAQISQESLRFLEKQSNVPNDANGILDKDVDADGETVNAETDMVEDSPANPSGQDTTKSWRAINDAEVVPLSSTEPSLGPSVPGDISRSSENQGFTPSNSPHLSKVQEPTKLQKTDRQPLPKHTKSMLRPKRSAISHVIAPNGISKENRYRRCKKNAFEAQIDRENLWMNQSMKYMLDALKINDELSTLFEGDVAISSKQRRNKVDGSLEKLREMIKAQGDALEQGINYIVSCGAREWKFTRRWGGV